MPVDLRKIEYLANHRCHPVEIMDHAFAFARRDQFRTDAQPGQGRTKVMRYGGERLEAVLRLIGKALVHGVHRCGDRSDLGRAAMLKRRFNG